ncbi:MAG: hypothetical protein P0Y65_13785 [Candidatus Devosia phytovorans]|uniref:Uncharacterized protein n=1 Tax=Candidatus Devosia phytovorans TaxID=3121372 RepID=A0AAJ6AYT4_9HYPH|nr:hypothetical protein [Devosia sp.]WEK03262.1 MAG: hypothetical protein P0Y65_13785 [Devosia sp.]
MVRSAALSVRVEPAVKEQLEKAAKNDGRTLAAYIERIIVKHLDEMKS